MESIIVRPRNIASNGQELTVLNKGARRLVLLAHQAQVERCTIPHLVIGVIKTTGEQNLNTRFDFGVLLANTKLGQRGDGSGTYNGVLQNDTVVDVADILGGVSGLGALSTKQVQNSDRELGEFAVLDELAEMGEG
jgi:hypothetical protein